MALRGRPFSNGHTVFIEKKEIIMKTLVVIKAHPYEGKNRAVGSEYDATDSDAKLLVLSGQAEYKSQQYQTRMMSSKTRSLKAA